MDVRWQYVQLDINLILNNSSEYQKYLVLKKNLKSSKNIKDYCKGKGLNTKEMITWGEEE